MAIKTFTTGEVLTASDTNTYLANAGLVYISEATATTGSTINVTNCFSATYDSYKVVISDVRATTGAADIGVKLLQGTTTNASNWIFAVMRVDYAAGTTNVYRAASQAQCIGAIIGTDPIGYEITITSPQQARYTSLSTMGLDGRGATGYFSIATTGILQNTTQYDGLQINCGGLTFSNVKVRVYGYRQS